MPSAQQETMAGRPTMTARKLQEMEIFPSPVCSEAMACRGIPRLLNLISQPMQGEYSATAGVLAGPSLNSPVSNTLVTNFLLLPGYKAVVAQARQRTMRRLAARDFAARKLKVEGIQSRTGKPIPMANSERFSQGQPGTVSQLGIPIRNHSCSFFA